VSQAELERAISETLIDEETLKRRIAELGEAIFPNRVLWVAWPKRASKVATDMSEDVCASSRCHSASSTRRFARSTRRGRG